MASTTIKDDCLAPEINIHLTYTGPDPWGVVKQISGSLKPFFHVSSSKVSQERLNWDISGDPITYWSRWWVKKTMSRYSKAIFRISIQGTKSKTDNTGQFTMKLDASMETSIGGPSILLKPFWVMYSYLFYNRVRRQYVDSCRDFMLNFRNTIKEHYNLRMTKVSGRDTVFD